MWSHTVKKQGILGNYEEEVKKVVVFFEFIRFALQNLPKSRQDEFFRQKQDEELRPFRKVVDDLAGDILGDDLKGMLMQDWKRGLRKKYGRGARRANLERIQDILNQSELLLLVSVFEFFLKEFTRQLATTDPKAVFANQRSEKKFDVWRLFDQGYSNFLCGMVEKEVKAVDQDSISKRAEYFQQHFGVSFGDHETVKQLTDLFEIRNNISHQFLDQSRIRIPSPEELKEARRLFLRVPKLIVDAACKKYPQLKGHLQP